MTEHEDDDSLWTFSLQDVTRVEPDPLDSAAGEGPTWAVTFDCNGPNLSAEVEVFVDDVEDQAQVIALAMSGLHGGFAAWTRATAGRRLTKQGAVPGD